MSVSIEALAMAGVDYMECGIDLDEWERREFEPPPPYLLAEDAYRKTEFYGSPITRSLVNARKKPSSFSLFRKEAYSTANGKGDGLDSIGCHQNVGLPRIMDKRKKMTGGLKFTATDDHDVTGNNKATDKNYDGTRKGCKALPAQLITTC
uniref:Uncharacterized protein n=1 Tax=Nelumbo nucifera TaxID=4432 RepID=A0A822XNT7_NELNU|nr:TPA_asm: hypothetical protein HUJ06_023420 [Nelumbo nucifera]